MILEEATLVARAHRRSCGRQGTATRSIGQDDPAHFAWSNVEIFDKIGRFQVKVPAMGTEVVGNFHNRDGRIGRPFGDAVVRILEAESCQRLELWCP